MQIRGLDSADLDALHSFIVDCYNDYPMAMWFKSRPGIGEIERIFYNKIRGVSSRLIVDLVAVEGGAILGECEIVKTTVNSGVVGIVIRKEFARKGLGTRLLKDAINAARQIGISGFNAEVDQGNDGAIKFFVVNGFAPLGVRSVEKNGKESRVVVLQKEIR